MNELTPKLIDIEDNNLNIYFKELDKVLESNNLNNIAITGFYGTGKSSIIETYLDEKKINDDVIKVSLSQYSYNEKEKKILGDSLLDIKIEEENRIEEQIINQIIHQINFNNIYLSNYRVKKNIPERNKWFIFSCFSFLLIIFYSIFFFISNNKVNIFKDSFFWLLLLFLILPICFISYFFIKYEFWKKISKIILNFFVGRLETNIAKNKFELSKLDEDYKEIVYALKYSKKKIVIFEDLDRLHNLNILTKLREINNILNISNNEKIKPIKFIFVLKENIFKHHLDKTKFFDFIIPIIPIQNSNNSYFLFKKSLLSNSPSDKITQMISHYIYDIRLIYNLCNEYNIYWKKIKANFIGKELNNDVLFALIIIKNIFPGDFKKIFNHKIQNIRKFNSMHNPLFESLLPIIRKVDNNDLYNYISDYLTNEKDRKFLKYLVSKEENYNDDWNFYPINNFKYIINFLNIDLLYLEENYLKIFNLSLINFFLTKITINKLDEIEEKLFFDIIFERINSAPLKVKTFLFINENNYNPKYSNEDLDKIFGLLLKQNYLKYSVILLNIVDSMNEYYININNDDNFKNDYKYSLLNISSILLLNLIHQNLILKNFEISKLIKANLNFSNKIFNDWENFYNFTKDKFNIGKLLKIYNKNKRNEERTIIYESLKFIESKNLFFLLEKTEKYSYSSHAIIGNNCFVELDEDGELTGDCLEEKCLCGDVKNCSNKIIRDWALDKLDVFIVEQKIFDKLFQILTFQKNIKYSIILSDLKRYKLFNLYKHYLKFFIKNFVLLISEFQIRQKKFTFQNDENTTIEILNSDEFNSELKKQYIDYNSTLISANKVIEIKDEEIRNYYVKSIRINFGITY